MFRYWSSGERLDKYKVHIPDDRDQPHGMPSRDFHPVILWRLPSQGYHHCEASHQLRESQMQQYMSKELKCPESILYVYKSFSYFPGRNGVIFISYKQRKAIDSGSRRGHSGSGSRCLSGQSPPQFKSLCAILREYLGAPLCFLLRIPAGCKHL